MTELTDEQILAELRRRGLTDQIEPARIPTEEDQWIVAELNRRGLDTHVQWAGEPKPEHDAPELFTGEPTNLDVGAKIKLTLAKAYGDDRDVIRALGEIGVPVRQDNAGFNYAELPDGSIQYIDRPETTKADVVSIGTKVLPYVAAGAAISPVAGLAPRTVAGGAIEGATDIAMQTAAGRPREDISLMQAAGAAVGGAAGEAVAPWLSRAIPGGRTRTIDADGIPIYPGNQRGFAGNAELHDLSRESTSIGDEARAALRQQSDAAMRRIAPREAHSGDVGRHLQATVEQGRDAARAGIDEAYDAARAVEGAGVSDYRLRNVNTNALREMGDLKMDTLPFGNPSLSREVYPQATRAMRYIDEMVDVTDRNVMSQVPAAQGGAAPRTFLDPSMIESGRQALNRAYASAARGSPDQMAVNVVRKNYDFWVDEQIADGFTFGDTAWVDRFTEARGLARDFFQRFTGRRGENLRGYLFNRIAENEQGGSAIANLLVGASGTGGPYSVPLVRHVRETFGDQALDEAKDLVMTKMVDGAVNNQGIMRYQTVSNRLVGMLRSDMATELFTSQERQAMGNVSRILRSIARPDGSFKPSGPAIRKLYSWLEWIPPIRDRLMMSAGREMYRGRPSALGAGLIVGGG